MTRSPSICGVILASQTGSLSGHSRFLAEAIELLRERTEMVIVVAGANAATVAPTVYAKGAFMIVDTSAEASLFGSLKMGLQEVLSRGRDAALITIADRPQASAATLDRLEAEFLDALVSGQWAVIPAVEGSGGYPFYVSREMIEVYLRSKTAADAHEVEQANAGRIRYVRCLDLPDGARSENPASVL